jgi:peptidoglycan biosynthesis protein MviN/MurJ (putative lipid II flippase)
MAPPKMNPEAMEFMMQIMNSGYIMPIIGAVFLFSGVSIIINKSKAFSLVLLAPIMLNIVLFHIRFGMDTITISAVLAALTVYLMVKNRDRYSLMCDCIHSCSKKKKK